MLSGLQVDIPGVGRVLVEHLVLDVNGTLACDGLLEEGVAERLRRLRPLLQLHLLTADTFGRQAEIDRELQLQAHRLSPGDEASQKANYLRALPGAAAAIGNGANDVEMLEAAALSIAVLGPEGLCREALLAAQVLTRGPLDALDLLLEPTRLRATLRR
jgi:soluble P-type ATPase